MRDSTRPIATARACLCGDTNELADCANGRDFATKSRLFRVRGAAAIRCGSRRTIVASRTNAMSACALGSGNCTAAYADRSVTKGAHACAFSCLVGARSGCCLRGVARGLSSKGRCSFVAVSCDGFQTLHVRRGISAFRRGDATAAPSNGRVTGVSRVPDLFVASVCPLSVRTITVCKGVLKRPTGCLVARLVPSDGKRDRRAAACACALSGQNVIASYRTIIERVEGNCRRSCAHAIGCAVRWWIACFLGGLSGGEA